MDRREFLRRVLGGAATVAVLPPLLPVNKLPIGLQMVPLDAIKIDWSRWHRAPYSAEHEMFGRLIDSIRSCGVLNPITVEENCTLIDGVYRIEAARAAGLTEIPAIVRDDLALVSSHREVFAGLNDAIMETKITRKRQT